MLAALLCLLILEQTCTGYLVTGSSALGVWDMETTQLLFTLDSPSDATPAGMVGSSSSASLAATTAPAAAAANGVDADHVDEEDDLLQNGWLLQDDDSDSSLDDDDDDVDGVPQPQPQLQQQQQPAGAAGLAGGLAGSGSLGSFAPRPWTTISSHGNLLAAGEAVAVCVFRVRANVRALNTVVGRVLECSADGDATCWCLGCARRMHRVQQGEL